MSFARSSCRLLSFLLLLGLSGTALVPSAVAEPVPTAAEAAAFVERAEAEYLATSIASERANWVQMTYIIEDTEILAAEANRQRTELIVALANQAKRFNGLDLPYDVRRKLDRLKLALTLPAPANAEETRELTSIAASMQSAFGRGQYCRQDGDCQDLVALSRRLATSRDAAELLDIWSGWRTVSPAMRKDFERYVELGNKGARELGFADLGAMWRSGYDMDPDAFAAELDRLWLQVRPLYEALHCHVRARLGELYGDEIVDPDGPIPAHLLGNMWAQTWSNIYDVVAPSEGAPGYDLSELLRAKGVDEVGMVRYGEGFFSSLGFAPLPETFWERSMFVQPSDRSVVCHASALGCRLGR